MSFSYKYLMKYIIAFALQPLLLKSIYDTTKSFSDTGFQKEGFL